MEMIFVLATLVVFGFVAAQWGANSNDGVDSPEWQHRHAWRGFGGDEKNAEA